MSTFSVVMLCVLAITTSAAYYVYRYYACLTNALTFALIPEVKQLMGHLAAYKQPYDKALEEFVYHRDGWVPLAIAAIILVLVMWGWGVIADGTQPILNLVVAFVVAGLISRVVANNYSVRWINAWMTEMQDVALTEAIANVKQHVEELQVKVAAYEVRVKGGEKLTEAENNELMSLALELLMYAERLMIFQTQKQELERFKQ